MLNKIKARCAIIAFIAILLTFLTQDTYAYYSAVGNATNVVTSGNI